MTERMTLLEQFDLHSGRAVFKSRHYFPIYQQHLGRFIGQSVTLLELGVDQGGSLQLWKQWLGPSARIIGIDANPGCQTMEEERIWVRIGRQEDAGFLQSVVNELGAPDIVIDDAGHRTPETVAAFKALYPLVSSHGVYVVEDIATSYWPGFGGRLGAVGSIVEHTKSLIDEMHAYASQGQVQPTQVSETLGSIHVYEHIVLFEKLPYVPKMAEVRGGS